MSARDEGKIGMSKNKNILIEEADGSGQTLVVAPLFTYRAFAEGDVAAEWQALESRLSAAEVQNVVIDLSALPFFGSTVLEWMVKIWKQIKDKPGKFGLCCVSPVGVQILQAARLHTVWQIYPSRAEAIAALAGKA
jgi:anti-anti-sigma factor